MFLLGEQFLDHSGETAVRAKSGCFARVRRGRLVAVRIGRLASIEDVESLDSAVASAAKLAGPEVIICGDHRFASPLPSDIADLWSGAMRRNNRTVVRSAILLDPANATFNLQMERIVRCAGKQDRRVFIERAAVYEWLDDHLNDEERAALRVFLDGLS
jgi:hypothetical protein